MSPPTIATDPNSNDDEDPRVADPPNTRGSDVPPPDEPLPGPGHSNTRHSDAGSFDASLFYASLPDINPPPTPSHPHPPARTPHPPSDTSVLVSRPPSPSMSPGENSGEQQGAE